MIYFLQPHVLKIGDSLLRNNFFRSIRWFFQMHFFNRTSLVPVGARFINRDRFCFGGTPSLLRGYARRDIYQEDFSK